MYGCVSPAPILILSLAVLVIAPRALDIPGSRSTSELHLYLKLFFFNQENSISMSKT